LLEYLKKEAGKAKEERWEGWAKLIRFKIDKGRRIALKRWRRGDKGEGASTTNARMSRRKS